MFDGIVNPVEVFCYFDGPKVFTFRSEDHGVCMAWWHDQDKFSDTFGVVPYTDEIARLYASVVREIGHDWLVSVGIGGKVISVVPTEK